MGFTDAEGYAKSVDAIMNIDDKLCFVEFKNGELKDARIKAKDSIMILGDIMSKTLSFFRNHAEYILVVNNDRIKSEQS